MIALLLTVCCQGDGEPVVHPVDASVGMTTVLAVIIALFVALLIVVDISCYHVNGCGLTMCICVHLCGRGVGQVGTTFKSNEKEVEEGERFALNLSKYLIVCD